jgi:1,4-alpha-glucan branching enzyme
MKGYLGFILHAHLPFVRHPEYERFLEEDWLYEAISETYLPLLRMFNRLKNDGVAFRITLSVSPTLADMLSDDLLQQRYIAHLERLIELGEKEQGRTAGDPDYAPLVEMYLQLFRQNLEDFEQLYRRNILTGFRAFEKEGYLEIITTAATHSFLPLYEQYPEAIDAQIKCAIISHGRNFGTRPSGFWLPECGYYPGLEKALKSSDLSYFVTAAHGLLLADTKPRYGVYAPMLLPNKTTAFGRDYSSSNAVWSNSDGYPGDYVYREFYRDIGYDLPLDYIGPFMHDPEARVYTGYKYYSISGKGDQKIPYRPDVALRKAKEHADNFLYNRTKQVKKLAGLMDRTPLIICPYDAELFGHWWFEGIHWMEEMFRLLDQENSCVEMITPSDYLKKYSDHQEGTPSFSSWGNKGYAEVWLDGKNDWIYRHIHKAIERMVELVDRYPNETGLKERVLNQASREVLLCMSSDWPFILKTGTTVPYAEKRLKEHLYNFNFIYENLCRNTVNTEWLTRIEKKNNVFPDMDYRLFRKRDRSNQ